MFDCIDRAQLQQTRVKTSIWKGFFKLLDQGFIHPVTHQTQRKIDQIGLAKQLNRQILFEWSDFVVLVDHQQGLHHIQRGMLGQILPSTIFLLH